MSQYFASLVILTVLALCNTIPVQAQVLLNGQPVEALYLAENTSPEVRKAAEDFARVVKAMTGQGLSIRTETETTSPATAIWVGCTEVAQCLLGPRLPERAFETLSTFGIREQDGQLAICGVTPTGTIHGLYWLLNQRGGVRWYFPGPLGEIIPHIEHWELGGLNVLEQPAFCSTAFSGLNNEDAQAWGRRNLLHSHARFSHNLHRVFSEKVLFEHPEWRAQLDNGPARYVEGGLSPQPRLHAPGAGAFAADVAAQYFAENPEVFTFALGINDTAAFDIMGAEGTRYFRNRPVLSARVFGFMNRAAAALPPYEPERYLGCLAYHTCEQPPPFAIDARVLPYLTLDTAQWRHPARAAEDLKLMEAWAEAGSHHLGLYDYRDSTAFLLPRPSVRAQAFALKEAARLGFDGYYLEAYPRWLLDGPAPYVLAQLAWDPRADAQALAKAYFHDLYAEAAPAVEAFFSLLENAWAHNNSQANWLIYYRHPGQLFWLTPILRQQLEAQLDEADALSETPAVRIRLQALRNAWKKVDCAATLYEELRALLLTPITDVASARDSLLHLRAYYLAKDDLRRALATPPPFGAPDDDACFNELLACTPVPTWIERLNARNFRLLANELPFGPEALRTYFRAVQRPFGTNLIDNPTLTIIEGKSTHLAFAQHDLPSIRSWQCARIPDATTQFYPTPEGGIMVKGCQQLFLTQRVSLNKSGWHRLRLRAEGHLNKGARVYLECQLLDANHIPLSKPLDRLWLPDERLSDDGLYALDCFVPAQAAYARVTLRIAEQAPEALFHLMVVELLEPPSED